LSSNLLALDDYMLMLTPVGEPDAECRVSVAEAKSLAARTVLFQLQVYLIEAFFDHYNGNTGQG
jgi:hypothetical protein